MFIVLILVATTLLLAARGFTALYAKSRIIPLADAPEMPVAIVFGAGLSRDGTPSPVLRDRVETAAALYFQGKVKKLLMSGDNRFVDYNEPGAMRQYALDLGVPAEDIVLDYAGRRTYDTCYRARAIFGVTEAILVTQPFHPATCPVPVQSIGGEGMGRTCRQSLLLKTFATDLEHSRNHGYLGSLVGGMGNPPRAGSGTLRTNLPRGATLRIALWLISCTPSKEEFDDEPRRGIKNCPHLR